MAKLWSGRFTKEQDSLMDSFHSSIQFDNRLYAEDIRGSIAHVRMLGSCGIITDDEAQVIEDGLWDLLEDIEAQRVEFSPEAEDIHMNIESLLIERIGDVARKLHTARSRNDQVALDTRMYVLREIDEIIDLIRRVQAALVERAEENLGVLMPGYTHLQRAQPILLSHHLMAYFFMLQRDLERLEDCAKRTNVMPLGAAALAGTTFPIDRERVAKELGFDGITENSIDAVSDRDFVMELLGCISIIMVHLSRFSEEIVLWSSSEFGFVTLDERYSTGSSIMPQKRNPDSAELVRGKSGRVFGNLLALLVTMKGLPLAYNKDMQEDKERLFDSVDTVKGCLTIMERLIDTMVFNAERMRTACAGGFMTATDVADYLVRKGIPFRTAHEIVGKIVLFCEKRGLSFSDLKLEDWHSFSGVFEEDVMDVADLDASVSARDVYGGTAHSRVVEQIELAKKLLG
ncbi:MAG: argininosuccinate lyase [Bacillota bacterium]|nr:argininosuccinate lyase [Bacillota bacterium]HOB91600.1 argininosuccinate lyase [Bacillota bacterium]HPZ54482.1 argininosuccinate lyase [Bacillota bacterium]HQD17818.1 argininosuccinate lyase [Bacillota bacterium]